MEEAIQMLLLEIKSGNLRYINGEANINVSKILQTPSVINAIKFSIPVINVKQIKFEKNENER